MTIVGRRRWSTAHSCCCVRPQGLLTMQEASRKGEEEKMALLGGVVIQW